MRRWLSAIVLLLPVAGLAATMIRNEIALASAEEWVIPVTGFDPRDLLYGHYIAFRYLWDADGDEALCRREGCFLCLEKGEGQRIVARVLPREPRPACPSLVDPDASGIGPGFGNRILVSETSAPRIEAMMRDTTPMQIVARLRKDGILMSERLEPVAGPK